VDGLRLNPGNIKDPDKVKEITRQAKAREIPIRIGVNAGSLPGRAKEGAGVRPPTDEVVEAMVNAALGHIHILESLDFNLIRGVDEGFGSSDDDRGQPRDRRQDLIPAAPGRHGIRTATDRVGQECRRDRGASRGRHRRYDPGLAGR